MAPNPTRKAAYGLSELERSLSDSFDSRTILCKSPFMNPDTDDRCEKLAYFGDSSKWMEVYYEDEPYSGHHTIRPASLIITRLYRILDSKQSEKPFQTTKRLSNLGLDVSIYETRKPVQDEMRGMLEKSYSSLREDEEDGVENIYVEAPTWFMIRKIRQDIKDKLASGEGTEVMVEVRMDNVNYTIDSVSKALSEISKD